MQGDVLATPRETDDIRDTAVLGGLFGEPADLNDIVDRLVRSESQELARELDGCKRDCAVYDLDLVQTTSATAKATDELTALSDRLADERTTGESIRRAHEELNDRRAAQMVALAAKRNTYSHRYVTEKIRAYAHVRLTINRQWLDDQQQLFSWQKELHLLETQRRELNKPEWDRRIKALTEQQDAARQRATAFAPVIDRLRRAGITRTVSGFLLWSGYLSFGAAGWLLGEHIRTSRPGGSVDLFASIGKGLATLAQSLGPLPTILVIVLVPPVLMIAAFTMLWFWDERLRKFDKAWSSQRRAKRSDSTLTSLLGRGTGLSRSSYTDVLARLPLAYLAGVIPVIIATFPALAGSAQSPPAASAWESLLYTYVGATVALVATGLAVLYVTHAVRTRLEQEAGTQSVYASLALNVELVAVVLMFLTVFIVVPTLRLWIPALPQPWALDSPYGPVMLTVMIAITTAHGLVFHGMFKDLRNMQGEVTRFEVDLQGFLALPSIEGFDDQAEKFKQSVARLYEDIDRMWNTPDLWALLLAQPPLSRKARFRLLPRGLPSRPQIAQPFTYSPWDVLLEPELVLGLQKLDLEVEATRNRLGTSAANRTLLESAAERLKQERAALLSAEVALKAQLRDRNRRCETETERIQRFYSEQIARARAAFRLGTYLRPMVAISGK